MSNARRVAVVRCAYFPQDPRVHKEVAALVEAGFRVTVLCLRMPDEPLEQTLDGVLSGVRVLRMNRPHRRGSIAKRMGLYLSFLLWASLRLVGEHRREPLSVVQVNTLPDFLVFCAVPVKLMGVRVVLDLHELLPELFGSEYAGRLRPYLIDLITLVERACIAFSDRVICPGQSYLDVYRSRGAPVHKFTIVYNVPDEGLFQREDVPREARLLMAHGSVIPRYGFDEIVRSMPGVLGEFPDAVLEVIGDGEHMPEIRRIAGELGVSESVRFVGRLPLEDMSRRVQRATLGVVATARNPFTDCILPNKVYELVALGVPVVSSDIRGLMGHFEPGAISYFESGNPDDLAAKVNDLLRSPKAQQGQADRAHAIYDPIRWTNNKRDYQRIFTDLCGRPAGD
ncbi:MAG TPA: glycosyltransferase [bacterium]|nr:glycosyltransferase [bacterium]